MKYRYKLKEQPSKAQEYQQKRIDAFDVLEENVVSLLQQIRNAKVDTIKYYKANPDSFAVAYPTDMVASYIRDIKDLLSQEDEE